MWIVNKDGLHEARTIKRLPVEERWGRDNTEWVQWVPWHKYKGAVDRRGDIPEGSKQRSRRKMKTKKTPGARGKVTRFTSTPDCNLRENSIFGRRMCKNTGSHVVAQVVEVSMRTPIVAWCCSVGCIVVILPYGMISMRSFCMCEV